ncbi:acetyl-CoA hydrolase/transferase family protein [Achromobacter aloeverae]|uniref:Acetyl-CoA hydrolase n=1 Tax=Achromobacter aloeverae TaxID=1750518 RepID=A0A4Q1HFD3_9BURK|nr:acetyl-CoA hydrolase/transferase C-terminal domain-containing protein [Achromobacter aloeverae]RXN84487.1 acetyl-CoA hydrolase [Achromobacter aloeverae]
MTSPLSLDALDLGQYIRPGDGIVFGQGVGEPLGLTARLVEQRARYSGAQLFLGTGFSRTFSPEHTDHLRFKGIGGIGTLRKLASAGALDPVPCHISAVGSLLAGGQIPSDVLLLSVSPPNGRGEYSFGLVNDYLQAALARARVVIAEINPAVPWSCCDRVLRAEDFTVTVESGIPPLELPTAAFGDLEQRIARHLAPHIPERATLQLGIGAVPEAILASLAERRGMGIHSGMIGDSVIDLIESGAIDNAHKGIDAGVTITGVLFGTQRLYRHAHENPAIRLCQTGYTHHMATLAQVRNLVSINGALEVDLTGQVNAEAIGAQHIGAVGGQVDFVRASVQTGGVSIIALSATGRNGESKITAQLSGPVTTARSDVDLVATEHGVARLRGRSLRERVRALTAIAAPEHRESLLQAARATWSDL